jgi:hypothetical protein
MSAATGSRIEAGGPIAVHHERVAALGAVVGLDVRLRAYPGPDPSLDAGQLRLIDRLRVRLPPHVQMRTEVPLPISADQRAWDVMLVGLADGHVLPLDADMRLVDIQAQTRRITLKLRDADLDAVVWLLADTDRNRAAVRSGASSLAETFPVPARRALAALAVGRHPGGSAIVLL